MARILHKMDASPPARTAIMVADLLGLDIELRDLHPLLREQDKPEYFKVWNWVSYFIIMVQICLFIVLSTAELWRRKQVSNNEK